MKHNLFISYRREGGYETAKMIQEKLKSFGYKVFLDFEEMRSGKFNEQLYTKIDECKDFILICSPNCFNRCINEGDWLRLEIMHALEKGKNIVPILMRNFEFPKLMPPGMEDLHLMHGVGASEELFDAFVMKLRKMLHSKTNLIHRLLNSGFTTRLVAFVSVFPVLIVLSIFWYNQHTEAFNMSIAVTEVNAIPDLPFKKGNITLNYGNKTEAYAVEKEIIIKDIPANYRKKEGKLHFESYGYNPLDTIIILKDNNTINLPIERDNSLGKIFGIITDEQDNPLEGVQVSVLDMTTVTDEFGRFKLEIPHQLQKQQQQLRAMKKGYVTFDRSSSFFSDKEVPIVLKSK